jgi:hypothetical protein
MKRKLIEMHQEYLVVCDNTNCNYKVINPTGDPNMDAIEYLNKPCPVCNENLLTDIDYIQSLHMMKIINWINKWFSWLMFFVPKSKKLKSTFVHFHDGEMKISKEKPQ